MVSIQAGFGTCCMRIVVPFDSVGTHSEPGRSDIDASGTGKQVDNRVRGQITLCAAIVFHNGEVYDTDGRLQPPHSRIVAWSS